MYVDRNVVEKVKFGVSIAGPKIMQDAYLQIKVTSPLKNRNYNMILILIQNHFLKKNYNSNDAEFCPPMNLANTKNINILLFFYFRTCLGLGWLWSGQDDLPAQLITFYLIPFIIFISSIIQLVLNDLYDLTWPITSIPLSTI